MDDARFDRVTRALGGGVTRRGALAVAAALAGASLTDVEAKRRRKRRKRRGDENCPAPWLPLPQGCALFCSENIQRCDSLGCDCYASPFGQICLKRVGTPPGCESSDDCAPGYVCQAKECLALCQPA